MLSASHTLSTRPLYDKLLLFFSARKIEFELSFGGSAKSSSQETTNCEAQKAIFNDSKQLSRRHLKRFPHECSNYPSQLMEARTKLSEETCTRNFYWNIYCLPSELYTSQPTNFCASFSLLKINIAWSMVLGGCFHVWRGQLCGIPALQIN